MLSVKSLQYTPSVSQVMYARQFSGLSSRMLRDIPRMDTSSSSQSNYINSYDSSYDMARDAASQDIMQHIYDAYETYQQAVPFYKNSLKYNTNVEGVQQLLPRYHNGLGSGGMAPIERGKQFLENRSIDGLDQIVDLQREQLSLLKEELTALRNRSNTYKQDIQGMADNVIYDLQLLHHCIAKYSNRPDYDLINLDYNEIMYSLSNQEYTQSIRESIRQSIETKLKNIMPKDMAEHVKVHLYGSSFTSIASITSDIDMSISGQIPPSMSDGALPYDSTVEDSVLLETKFAAIEHAAMLECYSGVPTQLSREMRRQYDNDVVGTPLHTKKRNMVQRISRFFDSLKLYNSQFLAPPRIRHPLVILKQPVPVSPYVPSVDAVTFNMFASNNGTIYTLLNNQNIQYFQGSEFEHPTAQEGNTGISMKSLYTQLPNILVYLAILAKDKSKARELQSYLDIRDEYLEYVQTHMKWQKEGTITNIPYLHNTKEIQTWYDEYDYNLGDCVKYIEDQLLQDKTVTSLHADSPFKYKTAEQISLETKQCVTFLDTYLHFFPEDESIDTVLALKVVDKYDGQVYTRLSQLDQGKRRAFLQQLFQNTMLKECSGKSAEYKHNVSKNRTIECDQSLNNTLGVLNSQLLKAYMNIDPRVGPLTMLVKEWAKDQNLHGARDGYLSSYAFSLLVIFYLQQIAILPVLQRYSRLDEKSPKHVSSRTIIGFYDQNDLVGSGLHDKSNILELFHGFMKYYSEFQWDKHVVSIRHGAPIEHTYKMRYHWDIMKSNFQNNSSALFMSLEDPFDLKHDLFRQCRGNYFERLLSNFKRTSYQLKNLLLYMETNTLSTDVLRSYRQHILSKCEDSAKEADLAYRSMELATIGVKGNLHSAPHRMRWLKTAIPTYIPRYNIYGKTNIVYMDEEHTQQEIVEESVKLPEAEDEYDEILTKLKSRSKNSIYEYSDSVSPMNLPAYKQQAAGTYDHAGIYKKNLKHANLRTSSQYIDPRDILQ